MKPLRAIALTTLVATTACSTLRPVHEPARYISENHPDLVRVVEKQHGAVFMIAHPRISGDTVVGTRAGEIHAVAVPLRDVHSVSARQVNGKRTALLLAGMALAVGLTTYVMTTTGDDNNWACDYSTATLKDNGGMPLCGPTNQ